MPQSSKDKAKFGSDEWHVEIKKETIHRYKYSKKHCQKYVAYSQQIITYHYNSDQELNSLYLKIKLNVLRIYLSDSIKYLGVMLNSTASRKDNYVLYSKLRRANSLLSKIRHYVPLEQLKSIYHKICWSHFSNGNQVWLIPNIIANFKINQ